MTYQLYAITETGKLNHAGTKIFKGLTIKKLKRYETAWQAWRRQYLIDNPGNYPLRECNDRTVRYIVHPVKHPDQRMVIPIGGGNV